MSHRVTELHSIMPIINVPSIMEHGLLSHYQASRLPHKDISLSEVQDRRDTKSVPGGLQLHRYANLYFCARNPMLFVRRSQCDDLCVLRVSKDILKIEGVVLSDQNAASDYARFHKSPQGLHHINFDVVFAERWDDASNQIDYWRKKSAKCAEVLVPHCLDGGYIEGAYVANDKAMVNLQSTGFKEPIEMNPYMFFM